MATSGIVRPSKHEDYELKHLSNLTVPLSNVAPKSFNKLLKGVCKTRFALLAYEYLASCSEIKRHKPDALHCAVCFGLRIIGIQHSYCTSENAVKVHLEDVRYTVASAECLYSKR